VSHTWAVVPQLDAIEHDADEDCVCGPTTLPLPTGSGEIWWMIVHHGLTAGEISEEYRQTLLEWAAQQ